MSLTFAALATEPDATIDEDVKEQQDERSDTDAAEVLAFLRINDEIVLKSQND